MKKARKILTLILVAVMVTGIFAGCSLFGRNVEKYRGQTVATVGNEKITAGKLLDTFNNMYYTYQQYISAGYMTLNDLFNNTMESLYTQYMKMDDYKTSEGVTVYTESQNKYVNDYENAKFVTQAEVEFAIKYVKYSVFGVFDNYLENYVAVDYDLADKEEEDTSRDFTKPDDMGDADSYAVKVYNDRFVNEDCDEYFADYYPELDLTAAAYTDYVYTSETDAGLLKKVENFNKRIKDYIIDKDGEQDEYPEITAAEYIEWQQKAVRNYEKNIDASYGNSLDIFITTQISDVIDTIIVYKYDLKVSQNVEASADTLMENLRKNYQSAVNAAKTDYNIKPDSFVTFIEGLSATSYIYDVPAEYQGKYIFVKNILIPFNDAQKAQLTNYGNAIKDTESKQYKDYREQLAAQIEATDFLLDDDADKVQNLFVYENGKLVINQAGALGAYFKADGSVTAMVKDGTTLSLDETVIELMKQYNTDTAQHTATYDYVVRIGDTPSDYTAKWVSEFVDAANDAYDLGQSHYGICVSTYGVHIVYYVKPVEAEVMDFETNLYNTSSSEYRFFKTYYTDQLSIYTKKATEDLEKKYKGGGLITVNKEFSKFLKNNGVEYDFDEAMKIDDEDNG